MAGYCNFLDLGPRVGALHFPVCPVSEQKKKKKKNHYFVCRFLAGLNWLCTRGGGGVFPLGVVGWGGGGGGGDGAGASGGSAKHGPRVGCGGAARLFFMGSGAEFWGGRPTTWRGAVYGANGL